MPRTRVSTPGGGIPTLSSPGTFEQTSAYIASAARTRNYVPPRYWGEFYPGGASVAVTANMASITAASGATYTANGVVGTNGVAYKYTAGGAGSTLYGGSILTFNAAAARWGRGDNYPYIRFGVVLGPDITAKTFYAGWSVNNFPVSGAAGPVYATAEEFMGVRFCKGTDSDELRLVVKNAGDAAWDQNVSLGVTIVAGTYYIIELWRDSGNIYCRVNGGTVASAPLTLAGTTILSYFPLLMGQQAGNATAAALETYAPYFESN